MPAEEVAERFEEHKVANLPALEGTMDQVASIWNRFASQPTGKPAKFDAFGAEAQAELGPVSLGTADSAPYLACMATCELVRVLAAVFGAQEMKGHLRRQHGGSALKKVPRWVGHAVGHAELLTCFAPECAQVNDHFQ